MDPIQDTFNESVSSILERRVRGWLSGVIDDMRRSSPVQQWLDSLPSETHASTTDDTSKPKTDDGEVADTEIDDDKQEKTDSQTTVIQPAEQNPSDDNNLSIPNINDSLKRKSLESGLLTSTPRSLRKPLLRDHSIQSDGGPPTFRNPLLRDHSLQSDASGSSGSSVLNVLGARKVDAESVLIALGFGPSEKQQKLQRIPDRFLVPSKLKGISTEKFIKDEHHSMRMHECGVFGYRGLTGNPHVPPSTIVAKIMDCILQGETFRDGMLGKARHSIADMRSPAAAHARFAARLRNNSVNK